MDYRLSANNQNMRFALADMQVDNQLLTSSQPVVLARTRQACAYSWVLICFKTSSFDALKCQMCINCRSIQDIVMQDANMPKQRDSLKPF